MAFTLVTLWFDNYIALIFITTSTSVLLSLMIFFGGAYQKKYLNILEWLSLINLILLSAIYNPWYGKCRWNKWSLSSISVAFVTFIGVLVYHECFFV